jgi:protein TonB
VFAAPIDRFSTRGQRHVIAVQLGADPAPATTSAWTPDSLPITVTPIAVTNNDRPDRQPRRFSAVEFSAAESPAGVLPPPTLAQPPADIQPMALQRADAVERLPVVAEPPATLPRRPQAVPIPPATNQAWRELTAGLSKKTPADLSANPPPQYPREAIARGLQGTVILRLRISAAGVVEQVEVVESSGHELIDRAAVEAVSKWRGAPARRYGRPVTAEEVLPIRFRL